jgi:hypothetical protein
LLPLDEPDASPGGITVWSSLASAPLSSGPPLVPLLDAPPPDPLFDPAPLLELALAPPLVLPLAAVPLDVPPLALPLPPLAEASGSGALDVPPHDAWAAATIGMQDRANREIRRAPMMSQPPRSVVRFAGTGPTCLLLRKYSLLRALR